MRATISLLRNGFEEEAVTFGHPRERVPAGGSQSPLWVDAIDSGGRHWGLGSLPAIKTTAGNSDRAGPEAKPTEKLG
jgi:hypothetical protein